MSGIESDLDWRGGTRSGAGNGRLFGDEEAVGRDAQGCVMVDATPATPFLVTEPDLLLEFLIVTPDAPTQLGQIDECVKLTFSGSVESQYLLGSASPSAHSINSHASDSFSGDPFVVPDADTHTREARG